MGAKSIVLALLERRQAMKQQDRYIAKEAFTFPLFCLVCLTLNIYWGCIYGWHVGAIIGTSLFGFIMMCYIGKYTRCGHNYLKIDPVGIEIKDWNKITILKWSEIKKCEVYYRPMNAGFSFWSRDLLIIAQSGGKSEQHIFVSLSGKYCRNKGVIEAVKRFGGTDVFDSESSHRQNRYFIGIVMIVVLTIILLALISCNNRQDLTDNYSVFTYGEGLYGECENDYPIFASELGYAGEPKYIPSVRQVWWNNLAIIIEQNNNSWWIVKAVDSQLSYGDKYIGPLSEQ